MKSELIWDLFVFSNMKSNANVGSMLEHIYMNETQKNKVALTYIS
jgi:hypothetical protein